MAFPARVEKILSRIGRRFNSSGKPLEGQLVRPTSTTGPNYAPTGENAPGMYDFICLWGEFNKEERLSGLIQDNEHILLIGTETTARRTESAR